MKKTPPPRQAAQGVALVDGGIRLEPHRLKRPSRTFTADWADLREGGDYLELIAAQTHPYERRHLSTYTLMISREAWVQSLFLPAGNIYRNLVASNATAPAREASDSPSSGEFDRIAVDWIAAGVGNGFAELICYRISAHTIHQMLTGAIPLREEGLVFPEVTLVLPAAELLRVIVKGRDLLMPGKDFP
jgi:hypothetical protein